MVDLDSPDHWTGGHYELAVELGEPDDERLVAAARLLWELAKVDGCFAVVGGRHEPAGITLDSLVGRLLHGVVTLPTGQPVPCGLTAWREREVVAEGFYGPDWVVLFIPIGGLNEAGIPTGGYPFGDFESSVAWRGPLDNWLAGIGISLYERVRYRLALVGMEVGGDVASDRLGEDVPTQRGFAYLVPTTAGVQFHAATT